MEGSTADSDNVQVWLQRTLACVACDGTVDACALAAVEFAHDLHVARTIVASVRANGTSDDVVLSGVRVPNPHRPGKLPALTVAESPVGSGKWHAYAGSNPQSREHVIGAEASPLCDSVVAALLAFSARSRVATFAVVAAGDVVSAGGDAWLLRMARALALRSAPWDMSAIDQEVGLARVLLDTLKTRCSRRADSAVARLADGQLSAADASAYEATTALWDHHGLALHVLGRPQYPYDDASPYGLRVFITAAERMQATPQIYLACVAPAIAARLQPGLDALDHVSDPRGSAPRAL